MIKILILTDNINDWEEKITSYLHATKRMSSNNGNNIRLENPMFSVDIHKDVGNGCGRRYMHVIVDRHINESILGVLRSCVTSQIIYTKYEYDASKLKDGYSQDETYVASECVSDDDGVWYICSKCGKRHTSDLDALMCCLE